MIKVKIKVSLQEKVRILNQVIDKQITELVAWELLWVSDRQIRNLLKAYKEYWELWLEHWLKWRKSNNHLKQDKENVIKDVMKEDRLKWCKPIFITEKLNEVYWVEVSKETVRKLMIENFCWTKKWKKKYEYRVRRTRRNYYWEMIQFDWSYHKWIWLEDEEYCLLVAIDDATWKIIHMELWDNEWYESVVKFWTKYILKHWVPRSIYLDKYATYKVNNHSKATDTKDLRTNFDRSMNKLWCSLITANSPQAKWRVERANQTLQDRLIHELIFEWIVNIENANKYIQETFIKKYNEKFWVIAMKKWNLHRKVTEEEKWNMKWIFAKEELRSLWYDYIIQYKKHFYQTEISKEYSIYPKKRLLVAETIDWEMRIYAWNNSKEKLVNYKELDYNTVRVNRAKYFWERRRIENERIKQEIEKRKNERFAKSKQKQAYWKAKRLLDKIN